MKSFKAGAACALSVFILWQSGAQPGAIGSGSGTIGLAAVDTAYTQDFNSLASTGTSSSLPNGWAFDETLANSNTTYTAGTGSGTAGDTYSFGAAASADRALGTLQSGSLLSAIGASFTNNTGQVITSVDISYIGEQWRLGALGRVDRLDFQYSTNATSLTTGTWTDANLLDFTAPVTAAPAIVGALDGNVSPNRTAISSIITGLTISNGGTFWIRWTDFNASGADDGLAVDDFSLTPHASPVPTNPTATGAASPSSVPPGGSSLLTVTVTPGQNPTSSGVVVTANLSAIGGSATQQLLDDGLNGDAAAFDNIYSYQATVAGATPLGTKVLPVSVTDAQSRSASTSITLKVTAPTVASLPFFQDWSTTGSLISADDDWSFVTGVVGYRGDGLTGGTGTDPRTILADGTSTPVDVNANRSDPNTFNTGGVAEFDGIANPVVALQGSGTAAAPFLLFSVSTLGQSNVEIKYNLRDLDGSGDDAVQQVALQYRIGNAGNFTNIPTAYVADATEASLATKVTPVDVFLPLAAENQPLVQLRIITTNAAGNDEWVGVDDISIASSTTSTNPTATGVATPSAGWAGDATLLTVTVTSGRNPDSTGLTVTGDLTALGGSATQDFFDDGTNGDVTAGDKVFSFQMTTAPSSLGTKILPVSVLDAENRSASATITYTVQATLPITPIYAIQGSGSTSPLVGQTLATTGIVTGIKSNGFFIQMPDGDGDGDPLTSDGIFVFGSISAAQVAVGDLVRVTANVAEFIPAADPTSPPTTELTFPTAVVLAHGQAVPVPQLVTIADINTTTGPEALERFEGMRVLIDAFTVVAPTGGNVDEVNATSSSNGTFYGVMPGVPRPLREPGLEPGAPAPSEAVSPATIPLFDGNPERIRVETLTAKGATVPLEVTAGATVTNLVGELDFRFRTYTILTEPGLLPSVVGNISAIPVRNTGYDEFTVASFNMERFFDTVNDPESEPQLTSTAFTNRLNKASLTIRNVMKTPDIIGVEEMEHLSTLQAVANKVNADAASPNVNYQAFLEEGNDVGGIDVGFLVNQARVQVIDVTQVGKTTTYIDPNSGLPATLNDRPSLILRANIVAPPHDLYPVTIIVNHLRSLSGVDDPADGFRIRTKRRAQAEWLAGVIQARQAANPAERIISVGDYNAFEFNDGYVDSIGTIKGTPTPAVNVGQASPDLVNPNLIDLVSLAPASQRYSFVFDGNAQELDHVLITQNVTGQIEYARNDADFPESYRADPNRSERISDHDPIVGFFAMPAPDLTAPVITVPGPMTVEATGATTTVTYTVTAVDNVDGAVTPTCSPASGSPFGLGTVTVTCDAIDAHQNASNAFFTITVQDTTPPLLTVPSPIVAEATSSSGAVVGYAASAFDLVDGSVTPSCGPPSGSTFPIGTTTVTCTATDAHLNVAKRMFTVTVRDTTPPVIALVKATPSSIWPPNKKMVPIVLVVSATDAAGTPACSLTGITGNDGATSADWVITGPLTAQVRADRTGGGSGRTYTLAVVCTDAAGNATGSAATVFVPHDQGK